MKASPASCVLLMHNYSSITAATILYMYLFPLKPMVLHGQMLLTYKHINLDLTNEMYKHKSNRQTEHITHLYTD